MKYPKGHDFEFKVLYPSQIKYDPLYQRQLDIKRVDRIAKEFDGDIFNEPKVSYRDGSYWCFNGQHSIAAWRKYHNGEDKPLTCKVFKGMTWLEECDAFCKQNGINKEPTTNEKLRAEYNSSNPSVVDMVNKAYLVGFTVDFVNSKTPTRIMATSTLFKSYNLLGSMQYTDMLTAIKEAWYGDQDAVSSQIITGMTMFYKTYYGNFSRDALVRSLKKVTPAEIIRNGRRYTSRKNTYSIEILHRYNYKRTSKKLDENQLG